MSATLNTPAERLALSRVRLREAMLARSASARGTSRPRAGGSAIAWLEGLKNIPGISILIGAVTGWWAQHPLRLAGMVAADAAAAVVRPVAQRHPLGLVLGGLLVGGLLAWSRPWRWIVKPALFAGMVPQLFSKAMALVPASSWMAVVTSLMQEQGRPQAVPAPPPLAAEPGAASNESTHATHPPQPTEANPVNQAAMR